MDFMNKLITIVEDEKDIAELVSLHLEKSGFKTRTFNEAARFWCFAEKNTPALVVLDLMLPDADGIDVCKEIKKNSRLSFVPVIILTAKSEETDKILGLELGADDYVTKPFSPKELVARVKAVLRRQKTKLETKQLYTDKALMIDLDKCEVYINKKRIDLTSTEFKLLKILVEKKGWVISRQKLLDYLWGTEKAVLDRTIDVHIKNLRGKLGKVADSIKNIRGMGYKFEE